MRLQDNPYLPTDWQAAHRQLDSLYRQIAQQLNQLSDGTIQAQNTASAAMPTSGTFTAGDFVVNRSPAILGGAGSRYVIRGWIRMTSGSTHVLNTDWCESRTLTGT
jgi:hypothetical protein